MLNVYIQRILPNLRRASNSSACSPWQVWDYNRLRANSGVCGEQEVEECKDPIILSFEGQEGEKA